MSVEAKVCTASLSSSWTWPRSRPTSATIRYGSLRIRYIMLTTLHTKKQLRCAHNISFDLFAYHMFAISVCISYSCCLDQSIYVTPFPES